MNDNYCDQSDGSDELLTSACSYLHVKYSCTLPIKGVFEQIPTSRVQDGVCDCCDGSDEIGTMFEINCPNNCDIAFLRRNRHHQNIIARHQRGAERLPSIKTIDPQFALGKRVFDSNSYLVVALLLLCCFVMFQITRPWIWRSASRIFTKSRTT